MSNYINNSSDEKFPTLIEMLEFKKINPPEVKYTPAFRTNGIIHKIKFNLHGKGTLYEQFTYNSTNNNLAVLVHYHKMYDIKTQRLKYKHWRLKCPKVKV